MFLSEISVSYKDDRVLNTNLHTYVHVDNVVGHTVGEEHTLAGRKFLGHFVGRHVVTVDSLASYIIPVASGGRSRVIISIKHSEKSVTAGYLVGVAARPFAGIIGP